MAWQVSAFVWENSARSGTALLMMLALAEHANAKTGSCWPSTDRLAAHCRITPQHARRILRTLEAAGEIMRLERSGKPSITFIVGYNPEVIDRVMHRGNNGARNLSITYAQGEHICAQGEHICAHPVHRSTQNETGTFKEPLKEPDNTNALERCRQGGPRIAKEHRSGAGRRRGSCRADLTRR